MENLKIVKVIDHNKVYKDKNNKEHVSVNYYLVHGSCWIAIRPSFSKGYSQLDVICETVHNGKDENEHKK